MFVLVSISVLICVAQSDNTLFTVHQSSWQGVKFLKIAFLWLCDSPEIIIHIGKL